MTEPVIHERSKYIWLWTGVSLFFLAIVVIWAVNTKAFIENMAFGKADKTDLLQQGKQDFEKTIELINKSDNTKELINDQKKAEEKQKSDATDEQTKKQLQSSILYLIKKDGQTTTTTP